MEPGDQRRSRQQPDQQRQPRRIVSVRVSGVESESEIIKIELNSGLGCCAAGKRVKTVGRLHRVHRAGDEQPPASQL